MKKIMLIFGITMFVSASSFADFQDVLNWFKGPRQNIRSIVITSNYIKPRLLADLIQAESRQPYVLLPAEGQKDDIYFCPVNKKQPAFLLNDRNVVRFINFANPERVYVLGGTDYVPRRYLDQLDPRIQIIMIPVKDWDATASSLSSMMDLPNLSGDFNKLNRQVERGFYNPGKYPAATAPQPVQTEITEEVVAEIPVPPTVFDNSPQTKRVVPIEPEPAVEPEIKQPPVMPKEAAKAEGKAEAPKAEPAKPEAKAAAVKPEAKAITAAKPVTPKPEAKAK
jgi:hypothetical protein